MKTSIANGILTLQVDFDILSTTVSRFETEVSQELQNATSKEVLLDLTTVKAIDSRGLNSLVGFVKMATGKGIKVNATISTPFVQQIFTLTRMEKFLPYKIV